MEKFAEINTSRVRKTIVSSTSVSSEQFTIVNKALPSFHERILKLHLDTLSPK